MGSEGTGPGVAVAILFLAGCDAAEAPSVLEEPDLLSVTIDSIVSSYIPPSDTARGIREGGRGYPLLSRNRPVATHVSIRSSPNGPLLFRYPDLPAIDDTVPDVIVAQVDLQFGEVAGEDPTVIFGDIRGIQAASDGTIYVLDYDATEIRAYDPDGRYLRTVARSGEGPGEITEANGIILSGDTLLWIHNHGKQTITGVDPAGEEVRRFNKPVNSWGYTWSGVFDNWGRYWRQASHSDDLDLYPPPLGVSTWTERWYYKFHDLSNAAVDSVFLGEGSSRTFRYEDANGFRQLLPIRFESRETIQVNPSGGFWRANTAEYRITRTSEEGDTLLVIEAGFPAMPITGEDRAAYVEDWIGYRGVEFRSDYEEVAGLMPDVKPILEGIFVDDAGRLWVERVTPDHAPAFYDLYWEDGSYLGSVRLGFDAAGPIWVQHGAIYTWITDEMDVPFVVRAPLS